MNYNKDRRSETMRKAWARKKDRLRKMDTYADAYVEDVVEKSGSGYAVVKIKFGRQWRKLFFRLEEE